MFIYISLNKIMLLFDLIVLAIAAFAAFKGYSSGFIIQAAYLAGLVLGTIFAGEVSTYILNFVHVADDSLYIVKPIVFIFSFALIITGVVFLGRLLTEALKAIKLNLPNRLAGCVFSILKYVFALSVLINVIALFNMNSMVYAEGTEDKSMTYKYIKKIAPSVVPYFRIIGEQIHE